MYRLVVWFYRLFDRLHKQPINLGDRSEYDAGEWNQYIGNLGEELTRRWLWAHGYKVLYQNYTAPDGGEIDVIFRDGETLVFCEVKTRTSRQFGRPADAVDKVKQQLITRGANGWLRELGFIPLVFRFDIVEVLLQEGEVPEVNHIENAFQIVPRLLA